MIDDQKIIIQILFIEHLIKSSWIIVLAFYNTSLKF